MRVNFNCLFWIMSCTLVHIVRIENARKDKQWLKDLNITLYLYTHTTNNTQFAQPSTPADAPPPPAAITRNVGHYAPVI